MQLAALETSWGISAEAEERFTILEELSVPGPTRWFAARERTGGTMRWLECAPLSAGHSELGTVAAKLYGVSHPHILQPHEVDRQYIAYEWRGEAPLNPRSVSQLPLVVRSRIAYQLVSAVEHLHSQAIPQAHGSLALSRIWLTPLTHWLKLMGLSPEPSSPSLLAQDLSDTLALVEELVTGPGASLEQLDSLNRVREEAGEEEGAKSWHALRDFLTGLQIELVGRDI